MNYDTRDAIHFLLGTGTDQKGRTVDDYHLFTDEKWEECHDHIQWAFPSDIPSEFNGYAPIIDIEDIVSGKYQLSGTDRKRIYENVSKLYIAYFKSIGLDPYCNWHEYRTPNDIRTPHNHNFRRITRVMRSVAIIKLLFTVTNAKSPLIDMLPNAIQIRDYLFSCFVIQCDDSVLSNRTVYHWYTTAQDIHKLIEENKRNADF